VTTLIEAVAAPDVEIAARVRRQALAVTAIGAAAVAAFAVKDLRLSLLAAAVVLGWTRLVGL
jgi:hypothetical protein